MPTEAKKPINYVVIAGNPMDGYDHYGPFDDHEQAVLFAHNNIDVDWWIAKLNDK